MSSYASELRILSHRVMSLRGALVLMAFVLLGCDENVGVPGDVDVPFAMYGILSPDVDTQSVRLFPVEDVPVLRTLGDLDVRSVDLDSGERRAWNDSTPSGSGGRVFWAPFRVERGRGYRIEAVRRSDGAKSFVEVRVPGNVEVRIDESRAPLLDVIVEGDDFRLLKPEAVYDIHRGPPTLRFEVSYQSKEQPVAGGWLVPVNMIVDAYEVNYAYNGIVPDLGGVCRVDFTFLEALGLRAIIGDAGWDPPNGVFDPNLVSQRGVLENVENGYGFVGAGYVLDVPLNPSRETVESACFRYDL